MYGTLTTTQFKCVQLCVKIQSTLTTTQFNDGVRAAAAGGWPSLRVLRLPRRRGHPNPNTTQNIHKIKSLRRIKLLTSTAEAMINAKAEEVSFIVEKVGRRLEEEERAGRANWEMFRPKEIWIFMRRFEMNEK